jgi:nucleoside-diphosphate-sugar epimerase
MNLLITGATGFLGSHLVAALSRIGHRVVGLRRAQSDIGRLRDCGTSIELVSAEDGDYSRVLAAGDPFDAVIHAATCYGRRGEGAATIVESNLVGPLRLLEAATAAGVPAFVNTDTTLDPLVNDYALSKRQFADWGRRISSSGRIRFLNVRLETLYGPGDDESKFVNWVVSRCLANVPSMDLTGGEQRRDFVYVDDAVEAYICLLPSVARLEPGFHSIGLGSGAAVRLRDLVETVRDLAHTGTQLNFGALPYREHEPMESRADISFLLGLGWRPRTSLADGIRNVIHCSVGARDAASCSR